MTVTPKDLQNTEYRYGFHDADDYVFKSKRGLSPDTVAEISRYKNEPEWMLRFRQRALELFRRKPMPMWGADLGGIDFENIFYYVKPSEKNREQLGRGPSLHQGYLRQARDSRGRA